MVSQGQSGWVDELDHLVVVVKDLDAVLATYSLLGFAPLPMRHHPRRGTAHRTLRLGSGKQAFHIEFLAVDTPKTTNQSLQVALERQGEGMTGLVLSTPDLNALAELIGPRLKRRVSLTRQPKQGTQDEIEIGLLENTGFGFDLSVIEPRDSDPEGEAEQVPHRNGASAVLSLELRVESVAEGAESLLKLLQPQGQGQESARQLSSHMGLDLLSKTAWNTAYGPGKANAALRIAVSDLDACHALLKGAGHQPVWVEGKRGGWRLAPNQTHGLWLTFCAD